MISTAVTTFTAKFLFILVDATIKATLLLAAATVIVTLSRRASASFRHLVWVMALACVFFMPLLSLNLPHWRVSVTVPAAHVARRISEAPPLDQSTLPTRKVATAQTAPIQATSAKPDVPNSSNNAPTTAQKTIPPATITANLPSLAPAVHAPAPNVPWFVLAFLVWVTGTAVMLVQAARGLVGIKSIVRGSFPSVNSLLVEAALAAASQMQVGASVELRQGSAAGGITVPLTFGSHQPKVVLPAKAEEWPAERLRAALLHEMAHIKRHDWALQMLGSIAGIVYWFNPLVWMALKRMRGESEAACDDLVLAAGVPAQDYARHLLDVALSVRDNKRLRTSAVAMAQGPKVEGRLRAILTQSLSRRPATRRAAAGFLTLALLVALPLAALRLVAQEARVPVPAANGLQLKGDFTLVYAVTDTNQASSAYLLRQYQQLRQSYEQELKKDPYVQPVPDEFYLPFAAYLQRQTQPHHQIITVSSRDGSLFYQTSDTDYTYARLYDGHSTQTFGDGHSGSASAGLHIGELTDCVLPAVGLPYVPLLKNTTLVGALGTSQTWNADILNVGAETNGNQPYYTSGVVHAVNDGGTWKLLDTDNSEQQWQFSQYQRFQGLWLASQMRLTRYDIDEPPPVGRFTTLGSFTDWFKTTRKPTEISEYHLLSASLSPPAPVTFVREALRQSAVESLVSRKKWGLYSQGFFVSEALHLRYHLQDWAEKHKALLLKMSQAPPTDLSAALAVGKSQQSLPTPLWQGESPLTHIRDGDPRVSRDGQKPTFASEPQSSQKNRTARDFEFARSFNPGTSHVILWASGRITQIAGNGRSQQEITPAFFTAGGRSNLTGDASPVTLVGSATTPAEPRSTTEAAALITLGQQLQQKGQPPPRLAYGFRRYLSPPFAGGIRVTFLYPSCDTSIHQGWIDPTRKEWFASVDCSGLPPVHWAAVRGQTPIPFDTRGPRHAPSVYDEFCSLDVGNVGEVRFPKGTSPVRQDKQWATGRHSVSLTDRHSHLRFYLTHSDEQVPALFQQTDPVIFGSFRVLPPGATVAPQSKSIAQTASTPPQLLGNATAAAEIALGQKLQQNGQPRDGIPEFRKVVQADPNNADAQFWLADALYNVKSKRFSIAKRTTTVFVPTPPAVLDEAILHLQKAVALRPNDAQWHSALGTYLSNRGRDAEAVSEYRKALHLFPQVSPPSLPLGEGEVSSGDAYTLCGAHWCLGDSLLKLKEYPSAAYQFRQSLRYRRTDNAFLGLGDALSGEGRRAEAKAAWKAVFTVSLHNPYYEGLARQRLANH